MFRMLATAAVLALSLSAAQADPAVTVRYGDLDLSSAAGTHVLNSRIQQAAQTTCAGLRNPRPPLFYHDWYAGCVRNVSAETTMRIVALSGRLRTIARK